MCTAVGLAVIALVVVAVVMVLVAAAFVALVASVAVADRHLRCLLLLLLVSPPGRPCLRD